MVVNHCVDIRRSQYCWLKRVRNLDALAEVALPRRIPVLVLVAGVDPALLADNLAGSPESAHMVRQSPFLDVRDFQVLGFGLRL